jgi:ribosomal protein S12 methylthiotransferase accessory factor YcaO
VARRLVLLVEDVLQAVQSEHRRRVHRLGLVAPGAYTALKDTGISVLLDLAAAGFDKPRVAATSEPPLHGPTASLGCHPNPL